MVERGEKGQLKKGSVLNPKGRPKRSREERYLDILKTIVTFEDWEAIIRRAVTDAKKGDATARKWLSDYIVGAPQQKMDVTSGGNTILVTLKGEDDES